MTERNFPFEFRTEEEFNALERILRSGGTHFNLDQLKTIIEAYEDYGGYAERASKKLRHSGSTLIHYWKKAGFEIRKRGERGKDQKDRIIDNKLYERYKILLEQGYTGSEIAKELEVSRQAVFCYIKCHGLSKPKDGRKSRK